MTCIRGFPRCSHHAVTHVFVNDPTKGYGISIQNMLSALNAGQQQAA